MTTCVTCTVTLRNRDEGVEGILRRGRGDIMQYNRSVKELFEVPELGACVPAAGAPEGWEEGDESVIETPRR